MCGDSARFGVETLNLAFFFLEVWGVTKLPGVSFDSEVGVVLK